MIKCLIPQYADKFLEGLKKGEIDPSKLTEMTTKERNEFFSKYVGKENSKFVNTQFESKLLLKNQQLGLINWAKNISGINETVRNDIISKIEKLDKVLDVKEENQFLSDIVEQRLGVKVTLEEANKISELTNKMRDSYNDRFSSRNSEYFKTKQELMKYIRERKPDIKATTALEKTGLIASNVLSVQRAIKTAFDFSAALRQGLTYFGRKQWNNAFVRMFDYAKSQTALDDLEVSMLSHKYSDEILKYKKDLGLTLLGENFNQREEAFASRLVEKIPLLKGSARAYEGFLNDLRFNRFADIIDKLQNSGVDIINDSKSMKDLARVIASATGRGYLGKYEIGNTAGALSNVLFSPRFMVSRIQTLLNPVIVGGSDIKNSARVEAAKSLATVIGLSVVLLGLAKMAGGDIEDDPTSSEFGKLKYGKTKFDITGGLGGYVTFLARQLRGETKNSNTNIINKLNSGEFGAKTRLDLLYILIENKTSPVAGILRDYLRGKTFEGKSINFDSPAKEQAQYLADALFIPLLSKDVIDVYLQGSDDNSLFMGALGGTASFFGLGISNYDNEEDWMNSNSKELKSFRDSVGDDKFENANKEFNDELNKYIDNIRDNEKYLSLSNEDKKKVISNKSDDIKNSIFKKYKFKYKAEKNKPIPVI